MNYPRIIAEIGCNHKGDMNIAKEMIMTAATYCKANVVKFQKKRMKNFTFMFHSSLNLNLQLFVAI